MNGWVEDWRYSLSEVVAQLPDYPPDDRFFYPLRHGSMRCGVYAPRGCDSQTVHDQDELYIIIDGNGRFIRGIETREFAPGDLIFVPAGTQHCFIEFSDNFSTWVIFWGPVGGE